VQRSQSQVFNGGWFVTEAQKVHGEAYDYEGTEYLGQKVPVSILCPIHGAFNQLPFNHLKGNGCARCWERRRPETKRLSREVFIERCKAMHGEGRYDYSATVYIDMHHRVTIGCPKHGEFRQMANKHFRGDGCPRCSESRGEREVRRVLTALGIDFASQWTHETLRLRRPLYFDFAIPTQKIAIEFDGEQHRGPVRFRGISQDRAERHFQLTIRRDAAKDRWASDRGWTLIRLADLKTVETDLTTALSSAHSVAASASP
jgi:very-short-patch-repair endonuclease